jgi:hypothetical protein
VDSKISPSSDSISGVRQCQIFNQSLNSVNLTTDWSPDTLSHNPTVRNIYFITVRIYLYSLNKYLFSIYFHLYIIFLTEVNK